MKLRMLISLVIVGAVGCHSQDGVLDFNDLNEIKISEGKLVKAEPDKLQLVIKNGVFLASTHFRRYTDCFECFESAVTDASASEGSSGTFSGTDSYSDTTTQEVGVAESDRVKYDGNTLFLASNKSRRYYSESGSDNSENNTPFVRILEKQADDSLVEKAVIPTATDAISLSDLYLFNDRIMSIYNTYSYQPVLTPLTGDSTVTYGSTEPYWNSVQKFGININDVSNTTEPEELVKYRIEGNVLSSRRIDNKIYVVSAVSPQIYNYYNAQDANSENQTFYNDIVDSDINNLLPTITKNGGEPELLVEPDSCYLPEGTQYQDGYNQITTLTTFDLADPESIKSICVVAPLDGLYASANNLYLHGRVIDQDSNESKTVIHQFAYNDTSLNYVATGTVSGHLAWQNQHLRFSENNGYLRVITSERHWQDNGVFNEHRLFVLKLDEEQDSINVVAVLPNEDNPAAIGKPDEDIYAVRYFGNKAYVVTFRQTDPLYVLDLADNETPIIAGELEIPGYSGYLQPLGENFILGIGQQIDPNGNGLQPINTQEEQFVEGAKAELYDVSNPAAPVVAATMVYENRSSVAEWDYHALTQLKVDDNNVKFSFPLAGWQQSVASNGELNWQYFQSMQMIDVNLQNGGSITNVGNLESSSDYYGSWGDRSVLHGDVVYYIRNNEIWQSYWSNPSVLNGPF